MLNFKNGKRKQFCFVQNPLKENLCIQRKDVYLQKNI